MVREGPHPVGGGMLAWRGGLASYPVRLPREERKQKTSPYWDNEPPHTSLPLLPLLLHLSCLALGFSSFTSLLSNWYLGFCCELCWSPSHLPISLLPVLAVSVPCNSVPSITSAKIGVGGGKTLVNGNHPLSS